MNLDNCIDEKLAALDQALSTNKRIKTFFPDKQACGEPIPGQDHEKPLCGKAFSGVKMTTLAATFYTGMHVS